MAATLGIVLNETNAIRAKPNPAVGLVLLERTFFDPPRRAAMVRWIERVQRSFPNAELVPYAWHLISHGPSDGAIEHATRTLAGEPNKFGGLQDSDETRRAWEVTMICRDVCKAERVAIRTPPSLTPGGLGRRRLEAFAEARKAEGIRLVWETSGLWEAPQALALGRQIGADVVLPAFEGGRPIYESDGALGLVGPGAWLTVTPVGSRQVLQGHQVDALIDHLTVYPDSTLLFAGRRALAALRSVTEAL